MLEYYSTLNIPAVPDHLVETEISKLKSFTPTQDTILSYRTFIPSFPIKLKDGTKDYSTVYNRIELDQVCIDWMIEHIPELANEQCEFGLQFIDAITNTSGRFSPHTDGPRGAHVISYILDTGSDSDVTTHWWREHGRDSYRVPATLINNYQIVDELTSVAIPAKTWHWLDSSILHSVHNVKTRRIAITVGFSDKELIDLILSKYKF